MTRRRRFFWLLCCALLLCVVGCCAPASCGRASVNAGAGCYQYPRCPRFAETQHPLIDRDGTWRLMGDQLYRNQYHPGQ